MMPKDFSASGATTDAPRKAADLPDSSASSGWGHNDCESIGQKICRSTRTNPFRHTRPPLPKNGEVMYWFLRAALGLLAVAALNLPAGAQNQVDAKGNSAGAASSASASPPSVRWVRVLGDQDVLEIEIGASEHIVPQTQMLTGPDRLVVDFPNAVPGSQLHNQSVNRGGVKGVRIGLFTANPPVTRIVFDLNSALPYQVFPAGRVVVVKLDESERNLSAGVDHSPLVDTPPVARPSLVNANFPMRPLASANTTQISAKPSLEVSFKDGMLAIRSNKSSLSDVLYAVYQRTGADIAVPASAEQEKIVADIGPGPAAEVLAHLLNGSKFNFLILNSASDPGVLDRVILMPRSGWSTAVDGEPSSAKPERISDVQLHEPQDNSVHRR
jgi:hypothetical protein